MTTTIAFSDIFNKHDTADHPENADRLYVMIDALEQAPFFKKIKMMSPEILPESMLYEVHSKEMIERVKEISETGDSWIDLDTYVCKSDYETARVAAGAVLQLCNLVMAGKTDNGYALVRPPGHHASPDRSMGFCLFNNAGIAAHQLTKKGNKVLIFDHDVHHGNGTQAMFYYRSDVMYQSFHLSPHYPGTGDTDEIGDEKGDGYTINAPLAIGHGDGAVRQIFDELFIPIARQFKPDLILISAGYDSHHADPLGGLKLSTNFFGEMIKRFQEIQPRIVCTLEGGYNLQWLGKCFLSQLGEMMSQPLSFDDPVQETGEVTSVINKMKKALENYWDLKA